MADDDSIPPVRPNTEGGPAIRRPRLLLGAALVIGFSGIALIFGQPPGLGYALAALVAAGIWVAAGHALGIRPSPAGLALIALALFYSAMVAVRASPALLALNVLAGIALALLIGAFYLPGRLARMSLTDYAVALVMSALALLYQPVLLFFGDLPKVERRPGKRRRLAPVLWGLVLAVPLLLVFGALFAAADAVFAGFLQGMFAWLRDYPQLLARLFLSLILSWLALGLARRAFTARKEPPALEDYANLDFLRLGTPTAITALALIDLLFLGFVLVQAVYLFGGVDTLARTGLTHSEYARRGFFELITVAALVLGLILVSDWLSRFVVGRGRLIINLLHGVLIALTLVILASALVRMRLYQQEFGLTELRFYTTAFMVWLGAVLVWLGATVLRMRAPADAQSAGDNPGRRRFAFGALIATLALLVALDLINPDALIARTNLARAVARTGQPLDADYLARTLSADAVPAAVAGLAALPDPAVRAELACGLQVKAEMLTNRAGRTDWRGSNWAVSAARRMLVRGDPAQYAGKCPD
jgi:hypothetical protein